MDEKTDKITKGLDSTGFGEINFYLKQSLTGHEYFRLYRMKKVRTATCRCCGQDRDDVTHVLRVISLADAVDKTEMMRNTSFKGYLAGREKRKLRKMKMTQQNRSGTTKTSQPSLGGGEK